MATHFHGGKQARTCF